MQLQGSFVDFILNPISVREKNINAQKQQTLVAPADACAQNGAVGRRLS